MPTIGRGQHSPRDIIQSFSAGLPPALHSSTLPLVAVSPAVDWYILEIPSKFGKLEFVIKQILIFLRTFRDSSASLSRLSRIARETSFLENFGLIRERRQRECVSPYYKLEGKFCFGNIGSFREYEQGNTFGCESGGLTSEKLYPSTPARARASM